MDAAAAAAASLSVPVRVFPKTDSSRMEQGESCGYSTPMAVPSISAIDSLLCFVFNACSVSAQYYVVR